MKEYFSGTLRTLDVQCSHRAAGVPLKESDSCGARTLQDSSWRSGTTCSKTSVPEGSLPVEVAIHSSQEMFRSTGVPAKGKSQDCKTQAQEHTCNVDANNKLCSTRHTQHTYQSLNINCDTEVSHSKSHSSKPARDRQSLKTNRAWIVRPKVLYYSVERRICKGLGLRQLSTQRPTVVAIPQPQPQASCSRFYQTMASTSHAYAANVPSLLIFRPVVAIALVVPARG